VQEIAVWVDGRRGGDDVQEKGEVRSPSAKRRSSDKKRARGQRGGASEKGKKGKVKEC